MQGPAQEQHAAAGRGCAVQGQRQRPQAVPKELVQHTAGLTHGSPAAFIVSRKFLQKVQLIGFESEKRMSFMKLRATRCLKQCLTT